MQLQTYDFLMLAVLGAATLFGFWKGLAWQVASLASLVVSYFAALKFADRLAPSISQHSPWNKFVAMLIIYAAASFLIWMGFRVVSGFIDRVKLNEFDRQMGALVGLAKGVLLCIAITFFAVTLLSQTQRERIIGSTSGQYIVRLLDRADAVTPPEIQRVIGPYIQRINERLNPNYQPNPAQDLQNIQQLWRQQAERAGQAASQAAANWTQNVPAAGWQNLGAPPANQPTATPATPAWPVSSGGERR